jgi:hypothetical protein
VGLLSAAVAAVSPTWLARPARAAVAAYCLVLAIVAARTGGGWRTLPVLATVHSAWGAGLLSGLAARLAARSASPDAPGAEQDPRRNGNQA